MKKGRALLMITFILFFSIFLVGADTVERDHQENLNGDQVVDEQMKEQVDALSLHEITAFWEEVSDEYGSFLPESQKGSFLDYIKGEKTFAPGEWGQAFIKYLFHEIIVNGKLLGTVILLTVFSTILRALQNAFEHEMVSRVAYSITFIVLIVIALNSFYVAMTYVQDTISNMVHFMIALFPLLLALLASTGALGSVALFHPLIIILINTSGALIEHVVLPLLFFSALLSLLSTLSEHIQVSKLAQLFRNVAMGFLGLFLTVFLGVISVQGATAAVADGVALRTAKFIAGNFVPVIGRIFTDATDTVLGASLLLKNTVGLAGLGLLFLICAFPAIKVLTIALIFHGSAAILQPLGGGPVLDGLSLLGKTVLYMFAALATVCLMFFLAITMIIISGNVSLMVR